MPSHPAAINICTTWAISFLTKKLSGFQGEMENFCCYADQKHFAKEIPVLYCTVLVSDLSSKCMLYNELMDIFRKKMEIHQSDQTML
jgi:hypothetical protein